MERTGKPKPRSLEGSHLPVSLWEHGSPKRVLPGRSRHEQSEREGFQVRGQTTRSRDYGIWVPNLRPGRSRPQGSYSRGGPWPVSRGLSSDTASGSVSHSCGKEVIIYWTWRKYGPFRGKWLKRAVQIA